MGAYDAAAALSSIDANVVWVLAFFAVWALVNLWMLKRLPAYSAQASSA